MGSEPALLPAEYARAVTDPTSFADRRYMDGILAWIRANDPVGRAEVDGFPPFWIISKHADVLEVSRRTDLFNSSTKPLILMDTANIEHMMAINDGDPNAYRALTMMDDPLHKQHRSLFDPWFHPLKVKDLESRVQAIADEFVELMVAKGPECDFANEIAAFYPLRVMMEIMGVPREDEQMMLELAEVLFNDGDPDANRTGQALTGEQLAEYQRKQFDASAGYFETLTKSRVGCPRNDLATILADARIDGQPLHPLDTLGHYLSFATAGHHTSSATLAGAFWALCENPELLPAIKQDRKLIGPLIEETLRRLSPAKHFMRGCIKDTELRGRQIRKGDWLYLSYPSANHDEDVFLNPFEFRLDRRPYKHFAFGIGPHQCVGQSLARMEQRLFLEAALGRLESIEFAEEPVLTKSRFVQGPKTMRIRYAMQ